MEIIMIPFLIGFCFLIIREIYFSFFGKSEEEDTLFY
jgi:hypothetical protein